MDQIYFIRSARNQNEPFFVSPSMEEKKNRWAKGLWDVPLGVSIMILRVLLGVVLTVGGWKLAFPADPQGLVASYIDPDAGWMAPLFVEWIENYLPVDILGFLNVMGWIEMTVGLALLAGGALVCFLSGLDRISLLPPGKT